MIGSAPGVLDVGEIADAINDDANAYTTLVTQIAAVQTDVDGNETDGDAADAALSARLDVLEADPTTATAVAAVQADVDQNEADADAADSALSARLDVLEADPTTATAVAAVAVDQRGRCGRRNGRGGNNPCQRRHRPQRPSGRTGS